MIINVILTASFPCSNSWMEMLNILTDDWINTNLKDINQKQRMFAYYDYNSNLWNLEKQALWFHRFKWLALHFITLLISSNISN